MVTVLLLIVIYLSFISLGLPDALLGSAWPSMYATLHVPLGYAGFIFMLIAGCAALSSIFSVRIIRRFGTGIVTAVSVFMTAAALIGFSLSGSFVYLCLCALPLGLGSGSIDAALNNYVALHYKARHMNWLHCFWGIGASLGPVIMSSFLLRDNAWGEGYRAVGILQLCLALLLFLSLPLWRKNKPAENPARHTHIEFKKLLHIPGVTEALIAFFCYCAVETIIGLWGASFLVIIKGIPPEIAAQWIAFFYIGITAGRFLTGFITIKINNRLMIRLGQAMIGGGIIILILPLESTAALPGLCMLGLGCAPILPALLHETPVNFGERNSQAIIGLSMGSFYIGTTVLPPLFGWLASLTGFALFPIFVGIALLIKIVLVEALNRKVQAGKNGNMLYPRE